MGGIDLVTEQPVGEVAHGPVGPGLGADHQRQRRAVAAPDELARRSSSAGTPWACTSRAASSAARPSSSIVCTSASQPCSNQALRRWLARGEHDHGRVGQLGDHRVAEMAVERADQLVRVEHDECRRRLGHRPEGGVDLGRERGQVAPVEPHRVEAAVLRPAVPPRAAGRSCRSRRCRLTWTIRIVESSVEDGVEQRQLVGTADEQLTIATSNAAIATWPLPANVPAGRRRRPSRNRQGWRTMQ